MSDRAVVVDRRAVERAIARGDLATVARLLNVSPAEARRPGGLRRAIKVAGFLCELTADAGGRLMGFGPLERE